MKLRTSVILGLLSVACVARAALAHPLAPSLLELREMDNGLVVVKWKTPRPFTSGERMRPLLPDRCELLGETVEDAEGAGALWQETMRCGSEGLVGLRVAVEGIVESRADVLLRIALADGRLFRRVLTSETPSFIVPEKERPIEVAREYLSLGVRHIATGFDHLAFVFGLLLLVSGRPLFWTITAFTLGHSITLSAAVLGFVRVPAQPLEAAIALSIVFLAIELTRDRPARPTLVRRFPWGMAATFGLLHGFGFAGALTEAGLPAGEIPLALFSFNLGIEIGQIAFVLAAVAAGFLLASRIAWRWPLARLVPAYVIGSLAAFWFFQRLAAI